MDQTHITSTRDANHRPNAPDDFMSVTPVAGRVRARSGDALGAATEDAHRLLEEGQRRYDAISYLPRDALRVEAFRSARRTHRLREDDCTWFDVGGAPDLAWSHEDTFAFAEHIRGRVAFDPARVAIEERPA